MSGSKPSDNGPWPVLPRFPYHIDHWQSIVLRLLIVKEIATELLHKGFTRGENTLLVGTCPGASLIISASIDYIIGLQVVHHAHILDQ